MADTTEQPQVAPEAAPAEPAPEANPEINPDEPPDFNIESEEDVEPFVLQLKAFLEKHDLDVKVKFKPKKMRGSTSKVDGDGLKTGEVNVPGTFTVKGYDNTGKPIDHGGDDVAIKVVDPEGNEVPCEVKDNGDGTYDVTYTPLVPGDHNIEVKVNDEELEGSPVKVYVFDEIPDALNCTVEGEGLEKAESQSPAPLRIITRNRLGEQLKKGGQKFDVKVEGPTTPAEIEIKDNEDGTYDVTYTPKEQGPHHIDIHVEVHGPKKEEAAEKPAEGEEAAEAKEEAAEGEKPAEEAAPAEEKKEEAAPAEGEKPAEEGEKAAEEGEKPAEAGAEEHGEVRMERIKGMPVDIDVALNAEQPDPAKCYCKGKGVEGGAKTCDVCDFVIYLVKPDGEPVTLEEVPVEANVTDPEDNEIEVTLEKGDEPGTYKAAYKPTVPGTYNVEVILRNPDVPSNFENVEGSPYSPEVLPGCDASKCVVSGPGVDGGEDLDDCNDAEFTIQAKDCNGEDIKEGGLEFEGTVKDPNGEEIPCEITDNGDGTYSGKYAPEFPGEYVVDLKFRGDKVGKSPYEVIVGEGVDNNKSGVDCFQFTIQAKTKRGSAVKPGNAKFSVKISNNETKEEVPEENIDVKNLKEAKYRVTYKVPGHGEYTIHCLLNNRDIKGSPWVQQC